MKVRTMSSPTAEETTLYTIPSPGDPESETKERPFLDRRGLCRHAVAHGSSVYGINNDTSTLPSWTWSVQLNEPVHSVTSNGSLVVAATERSVSLIQEGVVIITKQIEDMASFAWISQDQLLLEFPKQIMVISNLGLLSGSIAEAAKSIDIQTLELPRLSDVTAIALDSNTLRFIGLWEGNLFARDWKESTFHNDEIAIVLDQHKEWSVDPEVGLHFQSVGERTYLVCGASCEAESAVFWIDPLTFQPSCQYNISSRLLGLTPIVSLADNGTVAVALAEKAKSSSISVVQVVVEETMGLFMMLNPHVVYRIPIQDAVSVTLSPMAEAGAFRIKFWSSVRDCHYQVFVPSHDANQVVSTTRAYLAQGMNEKAEVFLKVEGSIVNHAIRDKYACFYPTEVALHRLRLWLNHGSNPEEAGMLLHRIAEGAKHHSGKQILIEAVDTLLNSATKSSLADLIAGLSALATYLEALTSSADGSSYDDDDDPLKVRLVSLLSKLDALKTLEKIGGESVVLERHFSQIKSTRQLFSTFIEERRFHEASKLCRLGLLSIDDLINPVLRIGGTVSPHLYIPLLRDLVLPKLTINGEMLAMMRAWACAMADCLDDTNQTNCDIYAAIDLLSTIEQASRRLARETHASFSRRSPFVATTVSQRVSPRVSDLSSTLDISRASSNTSDGSPKRVKSNNIDVSLASRPAPTILELGALQRGASKKPNHFPRFCEEYDGIEGNVETKLYGARCLASARKLGMRHSFVTLRNFSSVGGSQHVSTELIRILSAEALDHQSRLEKIAEKIEPFCREFSSNKEEAIFACCEDSLNAKSAITASVLENSASLARCCTSVSIRCQIALSVIRAALRCGDSPDWLSGFSKEAIFWAASDSKLQSELEEASRLLTVDRIVVRYCGSGARQLFRVDNSLHGIRLLRFVTNHIERPSIVKDALALCGAFHQLSEKDAGASILRNALLYKKGGLIIDLLKQLIEHNKSSAQAALIKTLTYAEEILNYGADENEFDRHLVLDHIVKMLSCALDHFDQFEHNAADEIDCYLQSTSVEKIRRDFLCIFRLYEDHGVNSSLSKLRSHTFAFNETCRLLRQNLPAECQASGFSTELAGVKRACFLLCSEDISVGEDIWLKATSHVLCGDANRPSAQSLKLLEDVGLLAGTAKSTCGQIMMALAFCKAAMRDLDDRTNYGMEEINVAASLVRDRALLFHADTNLASVVNLFSILDFISQILTRADEGIGEQQDHKQRILQMKAWQSRPVENETVHCNKAFSTSLCLPLLHPSWYIGDGLLLPPKLALNQAIVFSKSILFSDDYDNSTAELFEVLSERGAHFLSLRSLCMWSSACASQARLVQHNLNTEAILEGFRSANFALTERCLGGGGKGITNAKIDSELAVSFLLSLPSKIAFKAFKACLPTAVKTYSFDRLLDLANVGICAASGLANAYGDTVLPIGWKGQDMFLTQCRQFAKRAAWSIVLQRHGVRFDPQRLDSDMVCDTSKGRSSQSFQYAKSLMPTLIESFSKSLCPPDATTLALKFAEAFKLPGDLVFQNHVEFLLSPTFSKYANQNIHSLEEVARFSLKCIHSQSIQAAVLRRCVLAIENHQMSNYDRIDLVLTLYKECLVDLISSSKFEEHDKKWLEYERDLIIRRRDVLAVVSSFFQGEKESSRPCFSEFFRRLEETPSLVRNKIKYCSITGEKLSEDSFDPIAPLEKALREYPENGTATALAPLCIPLGFPSGFIHARFLVVRFKEAQIAGGSYPSFENDIVPVLDRLRSSKDKAELAEWCSNHYPNDYERLKCLELALQAVMMASTEVERCLQTNRKSDQLRDLENKFLEKIKQISALKESLSDHLKAKTILKSALSSSPIGMSEGMELLIDILGDQPKESPEHLIGSLLEEGSLVAADMTLNKGVSTEHLRNLSALVHKACTAVAEQHSHIITTQHSRKYATKWLMHGDENADTSSYAVQQTNIPAKDRDESEKATFVMDLTDVQTSEDWAGSLGPDRSAHQLTSEDEPCAMKQVSPRERSEYASQRAALRIAFVLAHQDASDDDCCDKENSSKVARGIAGRHLKRGALPRIDTARESRSEDHIIKMSREMLRIAFASGSSATPVFDRLDTVESVPKAATFAMRHRALRAAAVLCPQEALERVVRSDGMLPSSCSLRDCTYGAFVAKEIEEMGLPLPHDDLGRLSSMHYLSFARTLWRHHRGMRTSGRFLLLLLQMSLREAETDTGFVETLLQEMVRLQLPRTLLLASESLLDFFEKSHDITFYQVISKIRLLPPLLSRISKDRMTSTNDDMLSSRDALSTLERIFFVAKGMYLNMNDSQYLKDFSDFCENIFVSSNNTTGSSYLGDLHEQTKALLLLQE